MRALLVSMILVAVSIAGRASGQGMQLRTPYPDAVAYDAEWQVNDEPIVASGLTYYPTREIRMFDAQVMTQIDVYQGVPVYADMSMTPFLLAYVPLTPTRLRTYERGPDGERWFISGRGRFDIPPVGTAGGEEASPVFMEAPSAPLIVEPIEEPRAPAGILSLPGAQANRGVWIEYEGARWYHDGAAEMYAPDRFAPAGDYHGFAVYRERGRNGGRIWIASVGGRLLTPYRQR